MAAKRSMKRSTKKTAARGAKKGKTAKPTKAKRAAPKKAVAKKAVARSVKTAKVAAPKKAAARPSAATGARPPGPPVQLIRERAAAAGPDGQKGVSRLVWMDLMAGDPAKARDFYVPLLDWAAKDGGVPAAGPYTTLSASGQDFGGIARLPDGSAPSSWVPYFLVDNVEQTARKAKDLGGLEMIPPTEIPKVGRFAVVTDPTRGGGLGLLSFSQQPAPPPANGNLFGPVPWTELQTDDMDRSLAFLEGLFGWKHIPIALGDPAYGPYYGFLAGNTLVCGLVPRPPFMPANNWFTYFQSPSVELGNQRALAAGAQQILPPGEVPGLGRYSWLFDPQKASFGLFTA